MDWRGRKRSGNVKGWQVGLGFVVVFLLLGTTSGQQLISQIGLNKLSTVGTTTTIATTSAAGGQGVSCAASTPWQIQQKPLAYGSDTLAGTAAENAYLVSTGGGVPDLTGTTTFTSAGSYPMNGQFLIQTSETSTVTTYPVNYLLTASGTVATTGTTLATMGNGLVTAQVLCTPSSSNSNANLFTIITTPIQAPASGTSATTGAIMVCTAANGGAITTAATVFNAANDGNGLTTAITCVLEIESAYKGAGYNDCIYGTQANPVTNYATGQVLTNPTQGCVNFGMVAYIADNATVATGETVTLDPASPPGLVFQTATGNSVTAATQGFLISGFTGCNVAPGSASSTNYYPCLTFTVDVGASGDTDSGHVATEFGFVDGQQPNYDLNHFTTGAVTTFTSAGGAHAGLTNVGVTSTTLTPTSGQDSGAFGPLIEQVYSSIQAQ